MNKLVTGASQLLVHLLECRLKLTTDDAKLSKATVHALTLNKNLTCLDYNYPIIILTSTIKMIYLLKPWVTVGEWGFTLEAQTKCMVRSSQ